MDFQEAHDRREVLVPQSADRATARKRAADARLRRAIREAFARQRSAPAPPRLHVVRDDET